MDSSCFTTVCLFNTLLWVFYLYYVCVLVYAYACYVSLFSFPSICILGVELPDSGLPTDALVTEPSGFFFGLVFVLVGSFGFWFSVFLCSPRIL